MKTIKKVTAIFIAACIILSMSSVYAQNVDSWGIYEAYPTLNEMNLIDFSDACVLYYGLENVKPEENTFSDLPDDAENVLRLVGMNCIFGNDNHEAMPYGNIGEARASIILGRIAKALKENENLQGDEYQHLFDDVSSEMTHPKYWISKNKDAYNPLLSPAQIEEVNDKICDIKENYLIDIENAKTEFNGKSLAEGISKFESPTGVYLNGKEVSESYWEKVRNNIKRAKVQSKMKISYGLVTERTVLESYPIEDMLSDDVTDPEWDNFANTSLNVNDPLIVYFKTLDGKFAYVRSSICDGWVRTDKFAVCENKKQWLDMWKNPDFLVVTGDKIFTETTTIIPEVSKKMLSMGTILPLVKDYDGEELILDRIPYNTYLVKIPTRDKNGKLKAVIVPISAGKDVSIGFLPLTRANLINLAFKHLGNHYGWGGMLDSLDCSEFALMVYKCCGIMLPRNTTWQKLIQPEAITDYSSMTNEEKAEEISKLPSGVILQFPGHEMIYLGTVNGKIYTINSVSSIAQNDVKKRIRSVVVNSLDTKRTNGHTWLDDLNCAISPFVLDSISVTNTDNVSYTNNTNNTNNIGTVKKTQASPEWVYKLDKAQTAEQLFIISAVGKTTAYISMHEKDADGNWNQIITTPGFIGKNGLGKTKEGDGKTPVGVFTFNYAFGIADDPGCAIKYKKVTEDDYWSGDLREGHKYNEMVSINDIPDLDTENSEHIVDYDVHYQYCLNISYNDICEVGKGSAIFLHCLAPQKPYTGGCVAIPKDMMIKVMRNVKENCVVIIDDLKNISPETYEEWGL